MSINKPAHKQVTGPHNLKSICHGDGGQGQGVLGRRPASCWDSSMLLGVTQHDWRGVTGAKARQAAKIQDTLCSALARTPR